MAAQAGQPQHKTPKFVIGSDDANATGTALQRKAAVALVDAIRSKREVSTGQILRDVGFSASTALRPSTVTRSLGFRAELARLGLTEELVVPALVQDIKDKPGKRAFELSIAGKWLGLEKREPEQSGTTIQNAVIFVAPPIQPSVEPPLDDTT